MRYQLIVALIKPKNRSEALILLSVWSCCLFYCLMCVCVCVFSVLMDKSYLHQISNHLFVFIFLFCSFIIKTSSLELIKSHNLLCVYHIMNVLVRIWEWVFRNFQFPQKFYWLKWTTTINSNRTVNLYRNGTQICREIALVECIGKRKYVLC